jgi:aminoglycoside phosphotransferase (APT) family kinase protein
MQTLDSATVSRYLSQRLGAQVDIGSIKRTFPGVSRETYLVQAMILGERYDFAVRADPEGAYCCPYTLRHEWEIYSRLWHSEVPVAEPLWYDEGVDFAGGRPHMVRRLVDGSTAIPGLYDNDATGERLRRHVAFECAEKLAILHRLDWQSLGFGQVMPAPTSAREAFAREFQEWRCRWAEMRPYAAPVIDEALAWLSENIPTDSPRISLIKGNNGVGEEIWRDGRIVAMCDWELASLADGALDLAFSQGTLSLSDFDAVMSHYGACVGAEVSPHRLAFAHFFIWFKQFVCGSCYLYRPWAEHKRKEPYMLSFGLVTNSLTAQRIGHCIGRDLVEAFAELAGHESSYYRGIGK